jgi:hypothetical protein
LPRQSKEFRGRFDAGLKRLLDILGGWLDAAGISDGKRVATAMLSAMAGTMVVARAVSDKGVSEDLLAVVRDNLKAQIGLGDLATVVEVSQPLSSEIDLGKLIDRLMSLALEHAGADRGLLILPSGDELRIEAEAKVAGARSTFIFGKVTWQPENFPSRSCDTFSELKTAYCSMTSRVRIHIPKTITFVGISPSQFCVCRCRD